MKNKLKIIFAGTPEISRLVLASILEHEFEVALVLTQPDRPSGRGLKLTPSPVKQLALQAGIEVFQPESLRKNPTARQKIVAVAADIMVVVAYGLILPGEILQLPRRGCVNIHVSLLPRWRGAAPIQRAILAGDSQSGICIMQMDEGLDSGDILIREEVTLASAETSASLHDKLAALAASKIVEFLAAPDKFKPLKQEVAGVSYAHKLSKSEAQINWQEPAELIERKIRGFNPFPGAFCYLDSTLYKIWRAAVVLPAAVVKKAGPGEPAPGEPAPGKPAPGEIIRAEKDQLWIACGAGQILAVGEIQASAAKRQQTADFLHARPNLVGQKFREHAIE